MKALIGIGFKQVVRFKLLASLIVIALGAEFLGLRILRDMTFSFQGIVYPIGASRAMFVGLFLQLFTGTFLAAVYGIWFVPYLHHGSRGQISYCYPISKWNYILSYTVILGTLILLLNLVLLGSFALLFDFPTILQDAEVRRGLMWGFVTQAFAFWTLMFALAAASMIFGNIPAFFLGLFGFMVLQILGGLFRVNLGDFIDFESSFLGKLRTLYNLLPPWGELVFQLRKGFQGEYDLSHLAHWCVYLVLFAGLFRYLIRRPRLGKVDLT